MARSHPSICRSTGVVEFQILLEHKEQFRPVVAGQRRRDLGGRRPTPAVAKPRQLRRVAFPGDNGADDLQARLPGDVADHEWQLEIHLHQRLLHPLDMHRRELDQGVPVPHVRPQRHDRRGGSEAGAQQANAVQVAQPFGIRHVTLPARQVADVPRVH